MNSYPQPYSPLRAREPSAKSASDAMKSALPRASLPSHSPSRGGPGSALVNKFLCDSHRNAPALEVTKSVFEKAPKAPREGTRPTGNDASSAPL